MLELVAQPQCIPGEATNSRGDLCPTLFVIDEFARILGGGERVVLQLAANLRRHGFQPRILTFSLHRESAALQSPPCPIYLLPLQSAFGFTAIRAALEFRTFLRQEGIRVVHTFFGTSDIWAGFFTKTLSNANLIWSLRDMGFLRTRKQQVAYRVMSGFPDAVLAVSERVRRHAIDVDGVSSERVQTIYNGVNPADWSVPSKPHGRPGEFVVVTVGNIRRVKGQDLFIRAAATVVRQFPTARFLVVGEVLEDDFLRELHVLIDKLRLEEYLWFDTGKTNLRDLLAEADVFVLPSRSEGFSNAIIEAMACSLPVVATDVGGNSEAVRDGVTGIITPSEDADALASAIVSLLSNPTRAREAGILGRQDVEEKFTAEIMVGRVARVYRAVMRRSN